ncbi:MAG: response regulator [bacterium]|nr:response regulator [bacterium]
MKKEEFTKDTFIFAIKLFHKLAYPEKPFPQGTYSKILQELEKAGSLTELLDVLRKFNPELNNYDWGKKIRITIGSQRYPFLKLVLQESPVKGEYGFLVDRHSEFLGSKESISYDKELDLKSYLSGLKNKIESELIRNNLPSYRDLVKKYLESKESNGFSSGKKGTILLAEDEEDVHNLYKMELEILGYTVWSAFSGEDVLDIADETKFHCIVLDLMMPNVSGLDVLKQIGKEQKCIVLSALGDENTKKTCKDLGCSYYLEKPAEQTELEKAINTVLQK